MSTTKSPQIPLTPAQVARLQALPADQRARASAALSRALLAGKAALDNAPSLVARWLERELTAVGKVSETDDPGVVVANLSDVMIATDLVQGFVVDRVLDQVLELFTRPLSDAGLEAAADAIGPSVALQVFGGAPATPEVRA